jgi:hypothetical protein
MLLLSSLSLPSLPLRLSCNVDFGPPVTVVTRVTASTFLFADDDIIISFFV